MVGRASHWLSLSVIMLMAGGCASLRGTGDLGVVIERATGSVQVIETTHRTLLARITGLGDLSHASVVYSRDGRYAYVFGRDGGLTRIDLLRARIDKRVVQAGNAIGGAISQDGELRTRRREGIRCRYPRPGCRYPGHLR